MKPRILHISALPLGTGGIEGVILQISRSLGDKYNFGILVNADNEFTSRFIEACGGNVYPWSVRHMLDLNVITGLNRMLDEFRPNLVHVHDSRVGLLARPLLKIKKIPSVFTVHLPPYYYQWEKFTSLRRGLYIWVESLINHLTSTAVVYVAKRTYENALENKYTRKGQAHLIENGIDLAPFERHLPKKKDNQPPIICCVARLTLQKNITLLIQSASILKQQKAEFKLWIIGDGPDRSTLEDMVRRHGLTETIKFWGRRSDVADLLPQADIFTLPSLYETHPLAVMEAQAAGLPCVLSDVGDHSLLVNNPECGYIFNSNDANTCAKALGMLLTSPHQREKFGEAARLKAMKEYGTDKMAQGYDHLYETLLQNRGNV
jgi:glycosyltransferase involved in cell wall biosynthesis